MPDLPIHVHSHHKCATRWQVRLFKRIAQLNGLTFALEDSSLSVRPVSADIVFYGNSNYPAASRLQLLGPHVIRNPLSIIESAYWSHLGSHPTPDGSPIDKQRRLLRSTDDVAGRYLTLAWLSQGPLTPLGAIRAWDYADGRFPTVRMEDFVSAPTATLRALMDAGVFPVLEVPRDEESAFERFSGGRRVGEVSAASHYRSGAPDTWKALPGPLVDYVIIHYPDVMSRYPEVVSWRDEASTAEGAASDGDEPPGSPPSPEERDPTPVSTPASESDVPPDSPGVLPAWPVGLADDDQAHVDRPPAQARGEPVSAPSRLASTGGPARVCHVHIPKAAGMSLYRALERWATPARSIRYDRGGAEDLARFRQLTAADIAPLRLVAGHIGYPTFRARLGPEWIYITVLRDPVARMVSRFSYITSTPSHPWFHAVAGMDMDAFLAWYRGQPSAVDQQCMLICGKRDADLAIETAMHQLTLAAVIENLPVMVDRLRALIDHPLDVGRQNVSTERVRRDDLGSETLRAIEDFNGADRILYERVRDMVLVGTACSLPG